MKTTDFINQYKSLKKSFRTTARRITYGNMVAQNIADIIPPSWKITTDNWQGDILITGIKSVTPDMFDKLLAKLSKALCQEPSKDISKEKLIAIYNCYMSDLIGNKHHDYNFSIGITIKTDNTESCEVITREVSVVRTESELTGYCKALYERRYLEE